MEQTELIQREAELMESTRTKVLLYSVVHFLVDLACAYLLFFSIRDTQQWYFCVLMYNFCAFAVQMPLGLLADRLNRNAVFAASGCMLTAAAYAFRAVPVAAAVTAGIGNGMFHIGGGIDILNLSGRKSKPLGIFVAPGALGLYIGTAYGKQGIDACSYIVTSLLLAAVLTMVLQYVAEHTFRSGNEHLSFRMVRLNEAYVQDIHDSGEAGKTAVLSAMVCMFLVVCLRSYTGMTLSFPWKGQGSWGIILVCAVVLGKMAGGILADAFGAVKTTVASLSLSALLFLFFNYPAAGVAAVFLFNMTMPITLWAVSQILPGCRGFTFGLLTFGLFLGFLPVYLAYTPLFPGGTGFAAAAVISLALLYAGLISAGSGQNRSMHGNESCKHAG